MRTNSYGKNSITIGAVNASRINKIQTVFEDLILKDLTTIQIKTLLTKKCINIVKYLSLNINRKTILKYQIFTNIFTITIVAFVITISNLSIIIVVIISSSNSNLRTYFHYNCYLLLFLFFFSL